MPDVKRRKLLISNSATGTAKAPTAAAIAPTPPPSSTSTRSSSRSSRKNYALMASGKKEKSATRKRAHDNTGKAKIDYVEHIGEQQQEGATTLTFNQVLSDLMMEVGFFMSCLCPRMSHINLMCLGYVKGQLMST